MRDRKDVHLNQMDYGIPSITESEFHIAQKAKAALAFLASRGAMDLVDILGLTPHVESEAHAHS